MYSDNSEQIWFYPLAWLARLGIGYFLFFLMGIVLKLKVKIILCGYSIFESLKSFVCCVVPTTASYDV